MLIKNQNGQGLINLLTVLSIIGIVTSIAVSDLKVMSDPLANASFTVEHFVRLARARAISDTRVVVVQPLDNASLSAFSSDSCDGAITPIAGLTAALPRGATFSNTEWELCFNQRGLANLNVEFDLTDAEGQSKTVSVALGGGTRVIDGA